jgi:hypothetical protein
MPPLAWVVIDYDDDGEVTLRYPACQLPSLAAPALMPMSRPAGAGNGQRFAYVLPSVN